MSAASHPWSLHNFAVAMAHYNRWMNDKLYEASAGLSDEQRKADRGAFFKSIHGTLNHLVLTDEAWMQRMHGEPVTMISPNQQLHEDFADLRAARQAMDERIVQWAQGLTEADGQRDISFMSVTYRRQIHLPFMAALMQIFNHQTHHRGQVTTLLSQFGVDVGPTDIPVMPYWG